TENPALRGVFFAARQSGSEYLRTASQFAFSHVRGIPSAHQEGVSMHQGMGAAGRAVARARFVAILVLASLGIVAGPAGAQEDPQTALMTVIEPKVEADTTSASPLGDDFDPVTGTITFSATDISLPGNFPIPVELRRWVPHDDTYPGGPGGGWQWNIPLIRGSYLDVKDGHFDTGWDWGGPDIWRNGKHCTGSAATVITDQGQPVAGNAYWQGKLLHIPGVTSETF